MKYRVDIQPTAKAELREAHRWYYNSFRHGGRVGLDRSDGIDPHRRVTASLAAECDSGLDMRRATGRKIARQESDRSQQ